MLASNPAGDALRARLCSAKIDPDKNQEAPKVSNFPDIFQYLDFKKLMWRNDC
jgi:hypothetical protein